MARRAVRDEADPAGAVQGPEEQAERARELAERAREAAEQAEVRAEQAEEAADRAEELAGDGDIDDNWDTGDAGEFDDRESGWRFRPPVPPPMPPRPPHPHHHVHHGPADHHEWRDPAERLQDRVEQVIQRFEVMRDRADQLIHAAERVFPPGRSERAHKESGPAEPS